MSHALSVLSFCFSIFCFFSLFFSSTSTHMPNIGLLFFISLSIRNIYILILFILTFEKEIILFNYFVFVVLYFFLSLSISYIYKISLFLSISLFYLYHCLSLSLTHSFTEKFRLLSIIV